MVMQFVTVQENPALVKQYVAMRAELTKHGNEVGLPNGLIGGDEKATFLLAVDNGTVRAGIRLSVPDLENGGSLPADKVPGATLEAMFPDSDIATKMRSGESKVLYVDGIFSNMGILDGFKGMRTQREILDALYEYAKNEQQYDMVYCFPRQRNAKAIESRFHRAAVLSANLGPQPYAGHDGTPRGADKNLLVFCLDPQLRDAVREPPREMGLRPAI